MDTSSDYQMLYLIQLPKGNYSYVYTDNERNILTDDQDEENPYYVND
jgi:hypothetical protein